VFAFGDAAWTAFFISVPALVLARFGHHAWIAGIILGAFGVGALIGNAVAFRYLARRFDGFAIIGVCILAQAAPLWLLWLHLPWLGLAAVVGVSGIANGLVNPSLHTISTLRVPAHLRPTVFTTSMVGSQIVKPLGLFATGPIIDAYGVRPVLVAFAATQTVSMALIATTSLRELGRRRVVSTPVSDTA
jgi:predicted MFS family arabinose efflux permease